MTISNAGNAPAQGMIVVNLYASPDQTIRGDAPLLAAAMKEIHLKPHQKTVVLLPRFTWPAGLTANSSWSPTLMRRGRCRRPVSPIMRQSVPPPSWFPAVRGPSGTTSKRSRDTETGQAGDDCGHVEEFGKRDSPRDGNGCRGCGRRATGSRRISFRSHRHPPGAGTTAQVHHPLHGPVADNGPVLHGRNRQSPRRPELRE